MSVTLTITAADGATKSIVLPAPTVVTGTVTFPDASTTGVPAGTVLTAAGDIVTTAVGQLISAKSASSVTINHNNCILEKSRIKGGAFYTVNIAKGVTGTIVRDCEIDSQATSGACGINGAGTFLRNNIHNTENGINLNASGSVIQGNYIHGLNSAGSPHYDGIQIDGAVSNISITGNTVINDFGQTSAIMIDNYWGPIDSIKVDSNYLSGGGFTVYCDGHFNSNAITNVSITNNKVGIGGYGYTDFNGTNPVWTGNYDAVTGKPI